MHKRHSIKIVFFSKPDLEAHDQVTVDQVPLYVYIFFFLGNNMTVLHSWPSPKKHPVLRIPPKPSSESTPWAGWMNGTVPWQKRLAVKTPSPRHARGSPFFCLAIFAGMVAWKAWQASYQHRPVIQRVDVSTWVAFVRFAEQLALINIETL